MPEPLTFASWLERRGYAPKTVKMYSGWENRLAAWCRDEQTTLRRVTGPQIRAFCDTFPNTYSSRSAFRNALNVLWRFLERRDECPTWAVRVPREPVGICRALPDMAVEKLLTTAQEFGDVQYAIVCLLYYGALRRSEAALLPWTATEIEAGWLRFVGKGNRERRVPMHPKVADALARLPRKSAWVFPSPRFRGRPMSPATLNLWMRVMAAAAGLGWVTPHQLRHTALARANDELGDIRAVAEFAGHANVRTTMRYTRTKDARLQDVLGVL